MVPNLLSRVLMYGPLVCIGYMRVLFWGSPFKGSILRDHET